LNVSSWTRFFGLFDIELNIKIVFTVLETSQRLSSSRCQPHQ
jgi:hypothetical protein